MEAFLEYHGVTWPCQFGTPDETLNALAALGRNGDTGVVYSVLYVVRPDGTIRWSDRRARWRHEDADGIIRELQKALDDALGEAGRPPRRGGKG